MDRLNKIERLKDDLYASDYIVIKEYEGLDVSKYGDFHGERQAIREEIDRLRVMTDEEYGLLYPEELSAEPTDALLLSGDALPSEQTPTDEADASTNEE
jgi:hypothetical protein